MEGRAPEIKLKRKANTGSRKRTFVAVAAINRSARRPSAVALHAPFGSARVAAEPDQRRGAWDWHRGVALVAIAQVEGHHAAAPTAGTAPVFVQDAGAEEGIHGDPVDRQRTCCDRRSLILEAFRPT
jgi:hypothetical protein